MLSKTLIAALMAAATLTGTAEAAQPGLYYGTSAQIGRANLDGTGAAPIVATASQAGLALDGDTIFYASSAYPGKIGRVGVDGTGLNTGFITGLQRPFQFAVYGGKLYWTDYGAGTIGRANVDGTGVETIVTGLSSPTGIAVAGGHVYWSTGQMGNNDIGRANLDGSAPDGAWLDTGDHPGPLTLSGGRLHWVDSGGLSRADLDGTHLERDFAAGLPNGMSVAVGGGNGYSSAMGISRIGLDGTGLTSPFLLSGTFVGGLAAITPPAVAPVPAATATKGAVTKLKIENTGGTPLRVTGATATTGDFSVALGTCTAPVAPAERCELEVTFTPAGTTAGTRTASVDVTFADGVAPLAVAISGDVAAAPVPPTDPGTPVAPVAPVAPVTSAPAACTSVRTLAFHLRSRAARVEVSLGGKVIKRLADPKRVFTVELAGQPKGAVTVKITSRGGKTRTRVFKTCTPGTK
jgi:hypothetical protein